MDSLIRNYGLYWKEDCVFWGRGSNKGRLLGVPANGRSQDPVDFRAQIGVYCLYADYDLVYAGQAGSGNARLFSRLRHHRKDHLAGRWNRFSWFGLRSVLLSGKLSAITIRTRPSLRLTLDHMEAILIHSAEPAMNRQSGRFGKEVVQFLQSRDEETLGPSAEEMIRHIYDNVE